MEYYNHRIVLDFFVVDKGTYKYKMTGGDDCMRIYVDADACPVVKIVEQVAKKI